MLHRFRRKFSKHKERPLESTSLTLPHCPALSLSFEPSSHFLDYFMILSPRKSLLFLYPAFRFQHSAFERLLSFCFPPSESLSQPIVSQFVFALNDSLGICTHARLSGSPAGFLGNIGEEGVYCLCSVTRIPVLSAHFRFHEFIVDHILGQAHEAPLFDCEPARDLGGEEIDFGGFVPGLQCHPENPAFVAVEPTRIPVQFRLTMEFYGGLGIDLFEAKEYVLSEKYTIRIPRRGEAVHEIASYGFDILLSTLGVEHTVRVFRSVLLEQKMVFVGSDVGLVSLAAMTTLPLALPMGYKPILLPFLPEGDGFRGAFNSCNYCLGVLDSDQFQRVSIPSDITVIDLDAGTVRYPQDIPHLPGAQRLRAQLRELLQSMPALIPKRADQMAEFWSSRRCSEFKERLKLKYCFTPDESKKILNVFTEFVADIVSEEKICGCRLIDTTDADRPKIGFFKDAYMETVNSTDRDFFDHFLETRAFTAYFERAAR
jgi:hypothetical protein